LKLKKKLLKFISWKPKGNILYKNKETHKWIVGDGVHSDDTYTKVVFIDKEGNEHKASFIIKDNICSVKINRKIVEKNCNNLIFEKQEDVKWAGKTQLGVGSRARYWKYIVREID
jgi:hypothetical protein